MKISPITIEVIKNFSTINDGIIVEPGNVLKTIIKGNQIVARATVPDTFPNKFALFNLGKFREVLSLFTEPNITFFDRYLVISDGRRSIQYTYAEENVIYSNDIVNKVNGVSGEVNFKLTAKDMSSLIKAADTLGVPEIFVTGDGNRLLIQAGKTADPTGNTFSMELGSTELIFKSIFNIQNFKFLTGDYEVSLVKGKSNPGYAYLKGNIVEYWVTMEAKSKWG